MRKQRESTIDLLLFHTIGIHVYISIIPIDSEVSDNALIIPSICSIAGAVCSSGLWSSNLAMHSTSVPLYS